MAGNTTAISVEEPVPDYVHPVDHEEFRKLGYAMVDSIVNYRQSLEQFPVRSEVQSGYLAPLLPDQAPTDPETMEDIMGDVHKHIMPGMTHWQHPNFYAWYPANSSYPALLGDMLSSALGIIGFSWNGSPAATELETGSASEACLVALLAAKTRALKGKQHVSPDRLVAYATDQSHSCVKKACMIAGIEHLRLIPARAENGWALDPEDVDAAMSQDEAQGLVPCFLNTLIGTTSTAAVDPVADVAAVAGKHGVWTHVDAAYAGVFACLPAMHEKYFQGLEAVDSFATNPHKGMLVTFDCSALWVKDSFWLRSALSLEAQYQFAGLRHAEEHLDYKDWQIPLGRRFRALKLWFVLRLYGTEKIRAYLQHHLDSAAALAKQIESDDRFEIVAPPRFGLVCFRLRGISNEESKELLERINLTGKAFLVHTVVGGRHTIRFAIGGIHTQWRHVEATWKLIQEVAAPPPQPNDDVKLVAREIALE